MSRAKFAALESLQKIDLQAAELRTALEALPKHLAELTSARDSARAACDLQRGKLADNERARGQLEQTREAERDKVKKWESRLNEMRNPREYSALAREIDIARKADRGAEEEATRLMEEEETIGSEMERLGIESAVREKALAEEGSGIQTEIARLSAELAAGTKERDEAARIVERPLYARYEQIRKRRTGPAIVVARDGNCSGCNMRLPPQLYYKLHTLSDTVESCPACHRLLYAADETNETSQQP